MKLECCRLPRTRRDVIDRGRELLSKVASFYSCDRRPNYSVVRACRGGEHLGRRASRYPDRVSHQTGREIEPHIPQIPGGRFEPARAHGKRRGHIGVGACLRRGRCGDNTSGRNPKPGRRSADRVPCSRRRDGFRTTTGHAGLAGHAGESRFHSHTDSHFQDIAQSNHFWIRARQHRKRRATHFCPPSKMPTVIEKLTAFDRGRHQPRPQRGGHRDRTHGRAIADIDNLQHDPAFTGRRQLRRFGDRYYLPNRPAGSGRPGRSERRQTRKRHQGSEEDLKRSQMQTNGYPHVFALRSLLAFFALAFFTHLLFFFT